MMMNTLIPMILTSLVTALFTFFVTTLSQRSITKSIIKELIETHEKIYHKKPIEDIIKEHKIDCINNEDIKEIKNSLVTLINKIGFQS